MIYKRIRISHLILLPLLFFFSINVNGQKKKIKRYSMTIEASTPLEVVCKVMEKKCLIKSSDYLNKIRENYSMDIFKIFSADTIYLIGYYNYHESDYTELIWSKEDSIEYIYQFGIRKLTRKKEFGLTEMLPTIKSKIPLYWTKVLGLYCAPTLVYRIYRKRKNIYDVIIESTQYNYDKGCFYP